MRPQSLFPMFLCSILLIGGAMVSSSIVYGQSISADPANASLMLSGGENQRCRVGNINNTAVVRLGSAAHHNAIRYVDFARPRDKFGTGACVIVPLKVPIGSTIQISGVLQDTGAIPNAPSVNAPSDNVVENCFNVEAFSVGLAANAGSEFDPQSPDNIINAQGYGFMWYDSDLNIKPGPYTYTVVGCSGRDCPVRTTYYNTDSVSTPPACSVLAPLS